MNNSNNVEILNSNQDVSILGAEKFTRIENFIKGYRELTNKYAGERFISFEIRFSKFLTGFNIIKSWLKGYNLAQASDFNIFDILRVSHLETVTHTPFIKTLLDTSGTHGQGKLFYEQFIRTIFNDDENYQNFIPADYNELIIEENKATSDGYMDLFINYSSLEKKFAICIENKIYAADQPNQLFRYYDFIKNVLKYEDNQILIIYLHPAGNEPSKKSLNSAKNENDFLPKNLLKCISYKKHIKKWLKQSLALIKAESIKPTIKQYIKVIEYL